jgi:hypothetical protein
VKSRYRRIVRRKLEADRRLRLPSGERARRRESQLEPRLDDPIEMCTEIIDVATGELRAQHKRGRRS